MEGSRLLYLSHVMSEVIYKVFSLIISIFLLSINLLSIILFYKRDNYSHANTPLLYYESCAVPQSSDPPRLSQISGPFKARSSLSEIAIKETDDSVMLAQAPVDPTMHAAKIRPTSPEA